jgi:hypothetical protein
MPRQKPDGGAAPSDDSILDRFYDVFRGNDSFYIKHQAPFRKSETGKLASANIVFVKYTRRNPPPEGKKIGDFIPVTREQYREHLNGGDGLALTPLTNTENARNVCYHAVIDIDIYDVNFAYLVRRLYQAGLKFVPFLSKSGGLHIYFFFEEAEPADKAIGALRKVVETFGLSKMFRNGETGKIEIFPKQAVFVSDDAKAGCLLLPYYNASHPKACKTKMLTGEGKLVGIADALAAIPDMYTSAEEINAALGALPYDDAPYCIQMLLLSGALMEGDGRNNFLFCAAVYLKKKYEKDFKEYLEEMNGCLEAPLEQKDVDSIYKSVTTKGYDGYLCGELPCNSYCDKSLCALREYGVGKKRNNHFTGADCWGEISRVMAEQPYYTWKVRVKPEDAFRDVRVDSEKDLRNQSVIQERCWRDLNWAPFRVKDNDWIATVNKAMEGIENRQIPVPKETDTSEMGELRSLFLNFLTHCQVKNGRPSMVRANQVYRADGVYYFSTAGIMASLRFEKFPLGKVNLREQLIAYGCCEADLSYTGPGGKEVVVKCWKKPEDDELREMAVFYEGVYAEDEEILRRSKSDEGRDGGGGDEDVKF